MNMKCPICISVMPSTRTLRSVPLESVTVIVSPTLASIISAIRSEMIAPRSVSTCGLCPVRERRVM